LTQVFKLYIRKVSNQPQLLGYLIQDYQEFTSNALHLNYFLFTLFKKSNLLKLFQLVIMDSLSELDVVLKYQPGSSSLPIKRQRNICGKLGPPVHFKSL
jgi:hypothetical protein